MYECTSALEKGNCSEIDARYKAYKDEAKDIDLIMHTKQIDISKDRNKWSKMQ